MTRWLGAGFGACEGQTYGGNGGGEEHRDAQIAGDVAQHGRRQIRGKCLADRIVHPIPLSSSSRAPRLERAKPTASGVHARANVAASARHTRPTPTSATAPAKPTTPIMLDTNQMQTVSTAAAANTASERWRSETGPASMRRTRSGSFMPENTSPTDTLTDEMIAYAPKLKYDSSVAAAV